MLVKAAASREVVYSTGAPPPATNSLFRTYSNLSRQPHQWPDGNRVSYVARWKQSAQPATCVCNGTDRPCGLPPHGRKYCLLAASIRTRSVAVQPTSQQSMNQTAAKATAQLTRDNQSCGLGQQVSATVMKSVQPAAIKSGRTQECIST